MASRGPYRRKGPKEPESVVTVSWEVSTSIHSRNEEEFERKKAMITAKLQATFEHVEEMDAYSDDDDDE